MANERKVIELAREISDKYHEEYMEADGYYHDTGHYQDLLSAFIEFADDVERMLTKKKWYEFWRKPYFW